jgi:hypothetical protein
MGRFVERVLEVLIVIEIVVVGGYVYLTATATPSPFGLGPTQTASLATRPASVAVGPTVPPIPARVGSGIVSFGASFDPGTLAIVQPTSTFKRTVTVIAWSAALNQAANASSVTWTIGSRARTGVETTLISEVIPLSNPQATMLADATDLAAELDRRPGTYVVRYLRGGTVLAQGSFTLD